MASELPNQSIEPVRTQYSQNGFKMSLIQHYNFQKNKVLAMYERKNNLVISYEVQLLRLKKNPLFLKLSKSRGDYDLIWAHPSNGEFGLHGWAYKLKEAAERKYSDIKKGKEKLNE